MNGNRAAGVRPAVCRRAALLLLAGLTIACTGGGGDARTSAAIESNTVRMYLNSDPASLSLLGKSDLNAEIVAVQITDSLVQYDDELQLRPRVAESWELSDDRRTVTFRLRDGVRWHDGRPVTADDVVFSVETVRDPLVENRNWAPAFKDLESIEAGDARTVVARYTQATPDFLEGWRLPLIPRHVAGEDEDLLTGAFAEHPVGCGPFRFVRYLRGKEIVLEANDDYWDGRPAIDRLLIKIFHDERTAYQALLVGDLDVMNVSGALWEEARSSPDTAHLEKRLYQRLNAWVLGWNGDDDNPFFTDPAVRRALVLALDREQFAETVAHGRARPGITTYHPSSPWFAGDLEPWPYDPDEARRLLEQAGWRDRDGDGIRERDGRPFRFTLLIPDSNQRLNDELAAWQQQQWRAVGVDAEIKKLEFQAFRERRAARQFDASPVSLQFTAEPDQYDLYHSQATESFNLWGLHDPQIDELIERGRTTFDSAARHEIYRRLQHRLHELEPVSSLFHFDSPLLYDRRLQGIRPSPVGYVNTMHGPRGWSWSAAESGT